MSVLTELQEWYESQCDEDWEHQFGVEIGTLDNPGWNILINLAETELEGKPFQEISNLESEREWIRCWIEDNKFRGAGSPQKLEEILRMFLDWAKM